MRRIDDCLGTAESVVILGHIHPDGDCVGSCLGLRAYLLRLQPQLKVDVYLQPFAEAFLFLPGAKEIRHDCPEVSPYDLAFSLDSGDLGRLGEWGRYFQEAGRRICIDHHITNTGYGDEAVIEAEASSTCEVLCGLMDEAKLDASIAECLYLGIVHDTGVFKHSNTTEKTMCMAGRLIRLGARPDYIIDETFYKKSFAQNQMLGRALSAAKLRLNGAMISTVVTLADQRELGLSSKELDGIVDQLRVTEGVAVAAFLYELSKGVYKASLRSNTELDVSLIAAALGGGGHRKAAGFTLEAPAEAILDRLEQMIREALR